MNTTSRVTGKTYDTDNVWYITNVTQLGFYLSLHLDDRLLDVLYDGSRDQRNRVCFVYPKTPEMEVAFNLWMKHQEERKKQRENKE